MEQIIKQIESVSFTDDDTIANCTYDDSPNDAFDKGAVFMKKKIIAMLKEHYGVGN